MLWSGIFRFGFFHPGSGSATFIGNENMIWYRIPGAECFSFSDSGSGFRGKKHWIPDPNLQHYQNWTIAIHCWMTGDRLIEKFQFKSRSSKRKSLLLATPRSSPLIWKTKKTFFVTLFFFWGGVYPTTLFYWCESTLWLGLSTMFTRVEFPGPNLRSDRRAN